jgi:carboxypeptidase C (cathepsin A)
MLDAMTAPLTSAIVAHTRDALGWRPDRRYMLLNGPVSRAWDWGEGRGQPEALSALADVLALDPGLRVLVVHGYTDLVTPYFASTLLLRQLPAEVAPRVGTATYRGGHMFYTRPESRRALRSDAAALYGESSG